MSAEPLDAVPIGLLFVAVCTLSGLALEGGYRFGQWRHGRTTEEKEAPVGAMVASVLTLFGFLLAFTFALAADRFEARRQAVLDEANAIGTTYLRTGLLPEPQRGDSARLLREYVDVRVGGARDGRVEEAFARSEELLGQLWGIAVRAAELQPGPITGLYIQSLNEVIDMNATRKQVGLRSRIPTVIWVTLFLLGALGMASVGYQSGISATRRSPAMLGLILAFTCVLYLIADLDRSREGFLQIGQQPMIDLQSSMQAEKR